MDEVESKAFLSFISSETGLTFTHSKSEYFQPFTKTDLRQKSAMGTYGCTSPRRQRFTSTLKFLKVFIRILLMKLENIAQNKPETLILRLFQNIYCLKLTFSQIYRSRIHTKTALIKISCLVIKLHQMFLFFVYSFDLTLKDLNATKIKIRIQEYGLN